MKKVYLLIIALIAFFGVVIFAYNRENHSSTNIYLKDTNDLQMVVFDAGKADCILIKQKDHIVLVDTGESENVEKILGFFKKNHIDHIDTLIITHFDKDHVGGAAKIIQTIDINEVIQSSYIKYSTYFENYIEALQQKNLQAITVTSNYTIELGQLIVDIEGTDTVYEKNASNNSSLITSIKYKNTSYLLMGDIQKERIKDYLSMHQEKYDFLKIPYHGRYQKNLEQLINTVKPKYAVITCSEEESEDSETISLLKDEKCSYYLTRKGSILLVSDGSSITIQQD